jgi:hypothetical protein
MVFLKILRFKELMKKILPGIQQRAIQAKAPDLAVTLVVPETKEQVTVVCRNRQVSVSDESSDNTMVLPRRSMSRLLFGPRPEGLFLNARTTNQSFLRLLPLSLSFSWIDMV